MSVNKWTQENIWEMLGVSWQGRLWHLKQKRFKQKYHISTQIISEGGGGGGGGTRESELPTPPTFYSHGSHHLGNPASLPLLPHLPWTSQVSQSLRSHPPPPPPTCTSTNKLHCVFCTQIHTHGNDLAQNYRSSPLKWHADSGTRAEL